MPIRVPRAGIPEPNLRPTSTPVPDLTNDPGTKAIAQAGRGLVHGLSEFAAAEAKREALAAESEAQMRFLDYANDITAWEESVTPDPDKHTKNYREYSNKRMEERLKGLEGKAQGSFLRKARQFEVERLRHAITKQAGAFKERELTAQALLEDAVVRNERMMTEEELWKENGPWDRFEKEFNRRTAAGVKFPAGYLEKARDRLTKARIERVAQSMPETSEGYSEVAKLYEDIKKDEHPYTGLMSPEARHTALERVNTELTRRESAIREAGREARAARAEETTGMVGRFYARILAAHRKVEDPTLKRVETFADIEKDLMAPGVAERLGASHNALQDQIKAYQTMRDVELAPPTAQQYEYKSRVMLEIEQGKWDGKGHLLVTDPNIHPSFRDDLMGRMTARMGQARNKAESRGRGDQLRMANDLYRQVNGKTSPFFPGDPEMQAIASQAREEFLAGSEGLSGKDLQTAYHESLKRYSTLVDEKLNPEKMRSALPPGVKTREDVMRLNVPESMKNFYIQRIDYLDKLGAEKKEKEDAKTAAADKKKAEQKAKEWSLENVWNSIFGGGGATVGAGRVAPKPQAPTPSPTPQPPAPSPAPKSSAPAAPAPVASATAVEPKATKSYDAAFLPLTAKQGVDPIKYRPHVERAWRELGANPFAFRDPALSEKIQALADLYYDAARKKK